MLYPNAKLVAGDTFRLARLREYHQLDIAIELFVGTVAEVIRNERLRTLRRRCLDDAVAFSLLVVVRFFVAADRKSVV